MERKLITNYFKALALLEKNVQKYIKTIENSVDLKKLWQGYVHKNSYATGITYEDTIKQIKVVCEKGRLSKLKYLTAEISKAETKKTHGQDLVKDVMTPKFKKKLKNTLSQGR